jgi:hypothetical protein
LSAQGYTGQSYRKENGGGAQACRERGGSRHLKVVISHF